MPSQKELDSLWALHHAEWRDPAQVASQWQEAARTDPKLLRYRVRGAFWDILAEKEIVLLITREYEHLLMGLGTAKGRPRATFMPMAHPSGLVVDRKRGVVHVASTRNPNQIYDLAPASGLLPRGDVVARFAGERPLVPVRSRFLPGCLYLHDLALIQGGLYANAVGQNAVVRISEDGRHKREWWPRCIESRGGPRFDRNYIQLNSIAAGSTLGGSFFSASAMQMSSRRPGHRNFPVDKRGVVFSGATREVVGAGLTRPHSARLRDGTIWVDNSGYGEVGVVEDGGFVAVARLPGWTRGLAFHEGVAFVGTSRVLPRFRQYAPGLDVEESVCGVHAVDVASGKILGSLLWPYGNQIFAVDWAPSRFTTGFPFRVTSRATARERALFYSFTANHTMES